MISVLNSSLDAILFLCGMGGLHYSLSVNGPSRPGNILVEAILKFSLHLMSRTMKSWKTLSKKEALKQGKHLRVELHQIELPSGEIIEDGPWVITPDAVLVLAETARGDFLCFRQTKYAVEGTSLAPVGGMVEKEEAAIEAGKRELLEEAGYVSEEWIHLGAYALEPNRGVHTATLFLARRAKKVSEPDSDDLEDQELLHLSKEELRVALAAGEFKVITWAASVALALDYLETKG